MHLEKFKDFIKENETAAAPIPTNNIGNGEAIQNYDPILKKKILKRKQIKVVNSQDL